MTAPAHSEPVTITICGDVAEAQVVLSVLRASGVEAFIPDEHMAGLYSTAVLATNGVRVQVSASDAERARALLESDPSE